MRKGKTRVTWSSAASDSYHELAAPRNSCAMRLILILERKRKKRKKKKKKKRKRREEKNNASGR